MLSQSIGRPASRLRSCRALRKDFKKTAPLDNDELAGFAANVLNLVWLLATAVLRDEVFSTT